MGELGKKGEKVTVSPLIFYSIELMCVLLAK